MRADDAFALVLVSAWNDSGGGFLHRLFDGHPECFVYPFELQLGTPLLQDGLADWFRPKYRWPVLPAALDAATPAALFDLFLDEEVKGWLRAPTTNKFQEFDLGLSAEDWRGAFAQELGDGPRTPARVIAAYVRGLFVAWQNRRASGRERLYLGHCPTIVVDADRVLVDYAGARMIHVVRSPLAGFVDFRRRVPEMDLVVYCRKWSLVNALGFAFAAKYPERVTTVGLHELIGARAATMRRLCGWLGLAYDTIVETPTWNGTPLARMVPFGGVPVVSAEHERACVAELSPAERDAIRGETRAVARLFDLD